MNDRVRHGDDSGDVLPAHDEFGLWRRVTSALSIGSAFALLSWNAVMLISAPDGLPWFTPIAALCGIVAADFLSGIVHWAADTWGSASMPVIGRRLLHPFRVHHVNPDDFLRRRFVDTNGDTALVVVPILFAATFIFTDHYAGIAAGAFLWAFCTAGLLTNQVHQWAHMPAPPAPIQWLQDWGIILGRRAHQVHHAPPYNANYCIATGWCNRALAAIDFFRRLERTVTALTGAMPRRDEEAFFDETTGRMNHAQPMESGA